MHQAPLCNHLDAKTYEDHVNVYSHLVDLAKEGVTQAAETGAANGAKYGSITDAV